MTMEDCPSNLKLILKRSGEVPWIFLPGGPGLGMECFEPLFERWRLSGSLWTLDYSQSDNPRDWEQAVLSLRSHFKEFHLFAHSYGVMHLLSIDALESRLKPNLKSLVFCSGSPDTSCNDHLEKALQSRLEVQRKASTAIPKFLEHPTEENLRDIYFALAPIYFNEDSLEAGMQMLRKAKFNSKSGHIGMTQLFPLYKSRWKPSEVPTLICSGVKDLITPLCLFRSNSSFNQPNNLFLEIDNEGHFPWIFSPDNLIKILMQWELDNSD